MKNYDNTCLSHCNELNKRLCCDHCDEHADCTSNDRCSRSKEGCTSYKTPIRISASETFFTRANAHYAE